MLAQASEYFNRRRGNYWADELPQRQGFSQFIKQIASSLDLLMAHFAGILRIPFPSTVVLLEAAYREDEQALSAFAHQVETAPILPGAVSRAVEKGDAAQLNYLVQTALQAQNTTISQDQELSGDNAKKAEKLSNYILSYTKQDFLPEAILKRRLIGPWEHLFGTNKYNIYTTKFATDEVVIVKLLRDQIHGEDAGGVLSRFQREVSIWQPMHYDHILPFMGVGTTEEAGRTRIFSVSPYMKNLDAETYQNKQPCSIDASLKLALHVALALRYLHERDPPVIHFNVRTDNVLIHNDGRGLLSGFGFSREIPASSGQPSVPYIGSSYESSRFRAPEYYNTAKLAPKTSADVYGWAMTALQLVGHKRPFWEEPDDLQAMLTAMRGERPKIGSYPDIQLLSDSNTFWQLLDDCWTHDESKRPTIDTVVMRMRAISENQLGRRNPPVVPAPQPRRQTEGSQGELVDGRLNHGTEQRAPPQGRGR